MLPHLPQFTASYLQCLLLVVSGSGNITVIIIALLFKFREMLKERKKQLQKYLSSDLQGSELGRKQVFSEPPSLGLTQGWGVRWTLLSSSRKEGNEGERPPIV